MDECNFIKVLTPEDFNVESKVAKSKQSALKRPRCENWSEVDKELLKDLVKSRVKEVENKNTDTNTNNSKKKAWVDIANDFNSLCSSQSRSVCQLKSQWSTIKMQAKKDAAEFRSKAKQTGGGSAPHEISLSGSDISAWLPNEFVIDTNKYDSDFVLEDTEPVLEILVEAVGNETEAKGKGPNDVQKKKSEADKKSTPYKKKKISPEKNVTEDAILKVANTDVEYRKELHLLQMEVERKKIRNLDLEYDLIQARLNFYKKRSIDNMQFQM